jgi:mRNA-degrading endonuclease YafQ of YafQ-DinJ toxin-antitoxin module
MIEIIYAPIFVRTFKKLDDNLKEEILEKIEIFKNVSNHNILKVHKLNGHHKDCYSFSVNYAFRVIFQYESKNKVALLAIGNHDIYK